MIEMDGDALTFRFPDVHEDASLSVNFQRTLRIPDDGEEYPLPPGLGRFPLEHVDDHADRVPPRWLRHGGVVLPMYQAEALWIAFDMGHGMGGGYPFLVKIAAGKIDAVTGTAWSTTPRARPQDYVVTPPQPWLDGFCVEKGVIRQFVAMPLGAGYSAEEQITGAAEHGGLQIAAWPLKAKAYERWSARRVNESRYMKASKEPAILCAPAPDMGLAPGGRMRQHLHDDPFRFSDWDLEHGSRCFVHIANSLVWEAITGAKPPSPPPTAKRYTQAGLPWFDHYAEGHGSLDGAEALADLKSVIEMAREKGDQPLPENESVDVDRVIRLVTKRRDDRVREELF